MSTEYNGELPAGSILARDRIDKLIDCASLDEVVYVTAPCCAGKTMAVASWEMRRGCKAIWANLSESENSAVALMRRIAEALRQVSESRPELCGFLQAFEHTNESHAFIDGLLCAARAGGEQTLVLDGFHNIKNGDALRFARDVIAALLGLWRVVVISRNDLPPVFNDLMLKGRIRLVTSRELTFDPQEMCEYFKLNDCQTTNREIERLFAQTEGWPGALNVVLMVSRDGALEYGEAARGYIGAFFEREIWGVLDSDVKSFLLKTAVLDVLNPSSCRSVTNLGATLPMLRRLHYSGLLLKKPEEKAAYRYSAVFRDYLLDKLAASDIDEHELYMRAAWWHFEKGDSARAFQLFYIADNVYGINQSLRALKIADLGIEGFLRLAECITTLDINRLKLYPVIFARVALIHFMKGNLAEMQRLYSLFLQWIEPGALPLEPLDYAEYIWEIGWLSYLNPGETVKDNKRHEEWCNYKDYAPHMQDRHAARGAVFRFQPSILRGIRDYSEVAQEIERFLDEAGKTAQPVIREDTSVWQMHLIAAEYAYETEDFAKAEKIVSHIMDEAEAHPYCDIYFVCIALYVKLMHAVNKPREIDTLNDRLELALTERGNLFLMPVFHAFKARCALRQGAVGLPDYFMADNEKLKDKPYYYLLYRHITYARGLISLGEYGEAVLLLDRLRLTCRKYGRVMDLIEVNILKSIAMFGLGYVEAARRHLFEALTEGKKYGYIRIFSDDAAGIWPILESMKKQISGKYFQSVVISCKKALTGRGHLPDSKKCSHIKLTKTELSVLHSLKAGMSYQEISHDSNIRISTVKSHVHSIYSKLGVNNRMSAVMEAESQQII